MSFKTLAVQSYIANTVALISKPNVYWAKNPSCQKLLCSQARFRLKVEWILATYKRRCFSARQSDGWKRSLRAWRESGFWRAVAIQRACARGGTSILDLTGCADQQGVLSRSKLCDRVSFFDKNYATGYYN